MEYLEENLDEWLAEELEVKHATGLRQSAAFKLLCKCRANDKLAPLAALCNTCL